MDSQCQTYDLPQVANHDSCKALHDFLVGARGRPVRIDASGVRRTSARMALILATARRTWTAEAQGFDVVAPSDSLVAGLATLGLRDSVLAGGETA